MAVSRILTRQVAVPLVRLLLRMAESVVEAGLVRNPLEYYKELANQSSPWIALPDTDLIPAVKIFQVCSTGVKKLTAALALCPEGIPTDQGETVHILVLISAPASSVPSYLTLLAEVVRVLGPQAHRETLLASTTPFQAWAFLAQIESERAETAQPKDLS